MVKFWVNVYGALWLLAHLATLARAVQEAGALRDEVAALRARSEQTSARVDAYDRAWGSLYGEREAEPAAARHLHSMPGRRAG